MKDKGMEREIIEKCGLSPKTAKLLKDMDEKTYKEIATEIIYLAKPIIEAKSVKAERKKICEFLILSKANLIDVQKIADGSY